MKHEKKFEILSGLDEGLLEDALKSREKMLRSATGGRAKAHRRAVVLCACITLLCALLLVMGTVGLSMVTEIPEETETTHTPIDPSGLSDSQLLSLGVESYALVALSIQEPDDELFTSFESIDGKWGATAQIISFHASSDETVTIYPGRGAVEEVMECPHGFFRYCMAHVGRFEGSKEAKCHQVVTRCGYSNHTAGSPLTVAGDAKVVWQYDIHAEDGDQPDQLNYVVRDQNGSVTGAGSIYMDTHGHSQSEDRLTNNLCKDLVLRRCVSLGSRRYSESDGMTDESVRRLFNLYATRAADATEGLFDELTAYERLRLVQISLFDAVSKEGTFSGYSGEQVCISTDNPAYLIMFQDSGRAYFLCVDGWYPVAEKGPDYLEWILLEDGRKIIIENYSAWWFEDVCEDQIETKKEE